MFLMSTKKRILPHFRNALDELQLGINEIYARHGRKFSIEKYRNYFSEKTWYNGTVEPENFDERVLNQYEQENIRKLTEAMK